MYKMTSYFFWGLLLITFNLFLGINNFKIDLLPDTIGYILIGLAFQQLAVNEPKFEKGIICIGLSLIIHVIELVGGQSIEGVGLFSILAFIGTMALRLGYLYYMHEAVSHIIDENEHMTTLNAFKESNRINWKIMLILGIIGMVLAVLGMFGSMTVIMISIIPTIGMGIMQVIFLILLNRIKKQFTPE